MAKLSRTEKRVFKALFEGYTVKQSWSGKWHVFVEMPDDEKKFWPYYDRVSVCGMMQISRGNKYPTAPKFDHEDIDSCIRCKYIFTKNQNKFLGEDR